jgi:N-acetylglucosamine repressor
MQDGYNEKNLVIGNIDLVKQLNSAAVYRLIDQKGPISRIQIAELSQLAPASVTKITRQLLDRGLIKEVEQQASTGGRRAISIVSHYSRFHVIAVRLGRRHATVGLYDLGGKLIIEQDYSVVVLRQAELEFALFQSIDHFIAVYSPKIRQLVAIAVVLPGVVDPELGVVHDMPHISVDQWSLAAAIKTRFNIESFIDHDIRALALAEHYFGTTQDCEDSIFIHVHREISAGIIVGGHVFLNKKHQLGEIGHIQIDPLGAPCHCGRFGCLETVVSNDAIERRIQNLLTHGHVSQLTQENHSIQAICHACNSGDELATQVIDDVGKKLGQAIAIMANLFNPQKIVFAGHLLATEKIILPAIQQCVNNQVIKEFSQDLSIVTTTLNHQSAVGAFALVKRAMLSGTLLQQILESINQKRSF